MQEAGILRQFPLVRRTDGRHINGQHGDALWRQIIAEQAVIVGLQGIQAAAHQYRREWRFALLRQMQEAGDAAATFNAKLQLFQLVRQ
ncbi:hypothetical protein D3C78_1453050 [compost metagenome]